MVIETPHAIDRLVACLGISEGRARIKALEILSNPNPNPTPNPNPKP